ncbi:hypothetical protein KY284_001478 [Solanum tuberosum]|nr:hypothetical protein KY284_001478 [Solanum tuberosum]
MSKDAVQLETVGEAGVKLSANWDHGTFRTTLNISSLRRDISASVTKSVYHKGGYRKLVPPSGNW